MRHDVTSIGVVEHDHGGIRNLAHSTERRNALAEDDDQEDDQEPLETANRLYEEDELSDNDDGERCEHGNVLPAENPARHTPSVLAAELKGIPEQHALTQKEISHSAVAYRTEHKEHGEVIAVATPPIRMPRQGQLVSHLSTGNQQAASKQIATSSATTINVREEKDGVQERRLLGETVGDRMLHIASVNGQEKVTCLVE